MIWDKLNAWAMSDVEYDEEKKISVHRTLLWRSDEATDIIRRCDASLGVVRVYGEPSDRQPNNKCVNFVKPEFLEQG